MTNLLLNFPEGYTPNKSQQEILNKTEKAFGDGKKFVIINAPTGCLVGETLVMINRDGSGERMSLREIYTKTYGSPTEEVRGMCKCGCGKKVYDPRSKCIREHLGRGVKWSKLPKIRSLLDENLGLQDMLDVVYSGKKEVFTLTLENGMELVGTKCHPILTTNGYIPLGDLQKTDQVLIDPIWNFEKRPKTKVKKMYDLHVWGIPHHPFSRRVTTKKYSDGFTHRVPKHIFTYEATINNLTVKELKIRCKSDNIEGLVFVDPSVNVVHHIDENHHNNDPKNLKLMEKNHHLSYHAKKDGCNNLGVFKPKISNVKSITFKGIEDTFDIQCPNPYHNFVANGIVVHNSGKGHLPLTLSNSAKDVPQNFIDAVNDYSIFGEDAEAISDGIDPFGCYALTITKSLQDQYKNTFNETGVLKGQSNYQCKVDEELTVDIAPCVYAKGLKNDCWKACKCPYYNQRNKMLVSKFAALNYSMFFSLPEHLKRREFIVCDEGSELEDQLVSQYTCEVDIPFLVKTNTPVISFPTQETPTKVVSWISTILRGVSENIENYKEYFKAGKTDPMDFSKKKGEYSKLMNLQNSLDILIGTYYDSEYLIERVDKKIKFIPLKVDKLSKYLFDHADKVVIMSATIIDPPNFCKNLGITNYEYIEVDSMFDPDKAPIYVMASQKLNFKNMNEMLPKLAHQVEELLKEHAGEKGIIHTHTQFITDYIRKNVKSSRLICREAGVRNEDLLAIHEKSSEPTVLVSPSMTYGVDLKGDLGKFQIMLKAPWLPTKEIRIEKLMKIDKDWYSNAMLKTLIQACGRGIRSVDDECVTYILDGTIFDAVHRNKKKLPKFFIDRFQ